MHLISFYSDQDFTLFMVSRKSLVTMLKSSRKCLSKALYVGPRFIILIPQAKILANLYPLLDIEGPKLRHKTWPSIQSRLDALKKKKKRFVTPRGQKWTMMIDNEVVIIPLRDRIKYSTGISTQVSRTQVSIEARSPQQVFFKWNRIKSYKYFNS